MPAKKKSSRPTPAAQNVAVSIAMLEQQAQQSATQFAMLGDRFDRILEKVEQLTLNTTTLISRHDSQIQVLQKQLASTEVALRETRDKIDEMNTHLTDQLSKQIHEALQEMSQALDEFATKHSDDNAKLDRRITALERWRWMLIGAGLALGLTFGKALDVLKLFMTAT